MRHHVATTAISFAAAALMGIAGMRSAAAELSYTYIEGGYVDVEFDDSGADGDGFDVVGSAAITDMFHLFGSYTSADLDGPGGGDLDYDTWQIGGGVNLTMAEDLDFIGRLSYLNAEADIPGFGSADEDGFALYGGLRGRLSVPVELEGGLAYADLDNAGEDTSLVLAGRYYFTEQLALGISADIGDDVTVWGLNLRWEMPAKQ